MDDNQEFILEIGELLAQKTAKLETETLDRLHKNFMLYQKSVQTIFNVLTRKALLQEDPYKYEQKISEITLPAQTPIAENDKGMQMSIRLSNYESQLDFLNHYYQFSLDFLNMKRIKLLANLTTYIKWEKGASSTEPNTFILFEMMGKIQGDTDTVSYGIIKNAVPNLVKQCKMILRDLKELSSYHREKYKQDVREKVLPLMEIDSQGYGVNPEAVTAKVRQLFGNVMKGIPFYSDLINEMLAELYSAEGPAMQQALLGKYKTIEKKKIVKKTVSHKALLTEALKTLSVSGVYLEQALNKLSSNILIIEEKKETLSEKLKKWFAGLVSKNSSGRIMDLEIFEEKTSISKTIRIDFDSFKEKAVKQSRLLKACGAEMNQLNQKLMAMTEDELFQYLTTRVTELQKTTSFLNPIETFLKTEAQREQRNRLSSISRDIEDIKGCIKKTNSKRFDYSSRKEEEEQLKKLGIK